MGASGKVRSSAPSKDEARSWFYSGMAGSCLQPAAFFTSLAGVVPVAYICRPGQKAIIHSDILLPPGEGAGYLGLTRIGHELLIIVDNYSLHRPRIERIEDGGLIQFDFRLSGDVRLESSAATTVHMNRPGLFVTVQPQGTISQRLTAPGSCEKGITLAVTPQFLTEVFLFDAAQHNLTAALSNRARSHRIPLSALMYEVVSQFLAPNSFGKLSPRYNEGLALELLCAAVAELTSRSKPRKSAPALNPNGRACRESPRSELLTLPAGSTRH